MSTESLAGSRFLPKKTFIHTCLVAVLVLTICFQFSPIANAQDSNPSALCVARGNVIIGFIGEMRAFETRIATQAPSGVLRPGQSFPLNFATYPNCLLNCARVSSHSMTLRMMLGEAGPGSSRIRLAQVMQRIPMGPSDCDVKDTRQLTIAVPDPRLFGSDGTTAIETITIGVCPPNDRFPCAKQEIRVANSSRSGWSVTAPIAKIRALGAGPNRLPANREIKFSVSVTNGSDLILWPGGRASVVQLEKVSGPPFTSSIAPTSLDALGKGKTVSVELTLPPVQAGSYQFKACLIGFPRTGGGFEPIYCSNHRRFQIGSNLEAQIEVAEVYSGLSDYPANTPLSLYSRATNRTALPIGNRRLWARLDYWDIQNSDIQSRPPIHIGSVDAVSTKEIRFEPINLEPNVYFVRACIFLDGGENTNQTCGKEVRIVVGAKRRGVNKETRDQECTGGAILNGRQICVCPEGSTWSDDTFVCTAHTLPVKDYLNSCEGGREVHELTRECRCPSSRPHWDETRNRCVKQSLSCAAPFVLNARRNACVCPKGLTKIGNSCRKKSTKVPDRLKCPARAVKSGNKCICNGVAKWNRKTNKCVKPAVQVCSDKLRKKANGECCPSGTVARLNRCVKPALRCNRPLVLNSNRTKCVCPSGMRWNSSVGTCLKLKNAKTSCPKIRTRVDGKCCPKNQVARLNRCVKIKQRFKL